jgi:negative regulator of sigma E activity
MTSQEIWRAWQTLQDESTLVAERLHAAKGMKEKSQALDEYMEILEKQRAVMALYDKYRQEELTALENREWNPYDDPCYQEQEEREFAQMQAVAGWNHIQEIAPRESVRQMQALSVRGAAPCMSMN